MSDIKTIDEVWEEFCNHMLYLYQKIDSKDYSSTVFPSHYWSNASLELHTWNSDELDHNSVEVHEIRSDEYTDKASDEFYNSIKDLFELIKGNSLLILEGDVSRDLLHSFLCIFLRMCRVETPAFLDLPFVIEEINGEDEIVLCYFEILKWINTYDSIQENSSHLFEDESWDEQAAWRLTGFVSRMLPHPMFAKAYIYEDETVVEAPDANYPAAHSVIESIVQIWEQLEEAPIQLSPRDELMYQGFLQDRDDLANEFVSFLYKMRYIIDDEAKFKAVVDVCEKTLSPILGTREACLYDFVTETQILNKGLLI